MQAADGALASAKLALMHSETCQKDTTLNEIRQIKAHMKDIKGDYLGKTLKQAKASVHEAQTATKAGDMPVLASAKFSPGHAHGDLCA